MKRMKNKLHGFCHAHNNNEETYLRNLGWIEESESFEPVPELVAQVEFPTALPLAVKPPVATVANHAPAKRKAKA